MQHEYGDAQFSCNHSRSTSASGPRDSDRSSGSSTTSGRRGISPAAHRDECVGQPSQPRQRTALVRSLTPDLVRDRRPSDRPIGIGHPNVRQLRRERSTASKCRSRAPYRSDPPSGRPARVRHVRARRPTQEYAARALLNLASTSRVACVGSGLGADSHWEELTGAPCSTRVSDPS